MGEVSFGGFVGALVAFVVLATILFALFWMPAISIVLGRHAESELLFDVILQLCKGVNKSAVILTFQNALSRRKWSSISPVERDGHLLFGELALKFDDDDQLVDGFFADRGAFKRKLSKRIHYVEQ
jgi:hypothetical protein